LQRVAEQEGADLVLAAVPHGQRRHRVARVVGEHRDDRVDVAACQASIQRVRMSLTAASPRSRSTVCWVGAVEAIAWRARCSALLTAAVDVSSCPATSAAEKPGTSRRISAARCNADRCCNAATNASLTLSRAR